MSLKQLSDFDKLTFTVLKQYYTKQKPKVLFYRRTNFRTNLFGSELESELSNHDINNMKYDIFKRTFLNILDKYDLMKKCI